MAIIDKLFEYRSIAVNGCWIWNGATVFNSSKSSKYGVLRIGGSSGKLFRVHRLSYRYYHPIIWDDSFKILHHCGNSLCFNPEHLYIGDESQNAYDSVRDGTHYCAGKTHCPQGHSYGIYGVIARDGFRHCTVCYPKYKKWAKP